MKRIWRPNAVARGDYVTHVMLYDLVIVDINLFRSE